MNRYKELQATELGIFPGFPDRGYVKPDSGSPDVLSGIYWRGERPNKYINMCDPAVERACSSIRIDADVLDQDVEMELHVVGSRGGMAEHRSDQADRDVSASARPTDAGEG